MSAEGRNDARIAARLLALTAKECVEAPEKAPAQAVVLNNVFRLLEAYRVNRFFGLEPPAGYHREEETLSLIPQLEQHVSEVRTALERAVTAAFGGKSKDDAVATIADVLRRVTYPELGAPATAEKNSTARFFSEVVAHL